MKKVLVVDDARLMRNILRGILADEMECTVIEAENGETAVELYKEHHPDAVTMDLTMERLNGLQAAKAILAYDCSANIVIVTSMGQERLLEECLDAGVRDFIVKPFTRERIRNAVGRALGLGRGAARPSVRNVF
jgi:two-component system, chemotaxis family, chemotaxis protein CheY